MLERAVPPPIAAELLEPEPMIVGFTFVAL